MTTLTRSATSRTLAARTGARPVALAVASLVVSLVAGCVRPSEERAAPAPVIPPAPTTADTGARRVASTLREAIQLATAASQANDLPATIRYLEQAEAYAPGHPLVVDQIAKFRLRSGDHAGAIAALRRLALLGSARLIGEDSAYAPLFGHPDFKRIAETMATVSHPLVGGDTAFVVRVPDLLVEGITHDRTSGGVVRFYLGSMSTGRVVRVTEGSRSEPPVNVVRADGRVLGLRVDDLGRLWVAVWRPAPVPADSARPLATSSLFVYDARGGQLLHRFDSPGDGAPHLFNDIALGAEGEAWITDSDANRVWRADVRTGVLTPVISGERDVTYPNGITLAPGGRMLYVAHSEGISIWEPAAGVRTRLAHGADLTLTGIDGLYACGTGLVAVQRLAGYERIVWLRLSRDGRGVIASEVLEQAHPSYAQPTTGTIAGDAFYYVATSELRRHLPDGSLAPATQPSRTLVLRVPLGDRCG